VENGHKNANLRKTLVKKMGKTPGETDRVSKKNRGKNKKIRTERVILTSSESDWEVGEKTL